MLDLEPATRMLADLVRGVREEQLTLPTPCAGASLGDLLDHVDGLSITFTAAARKTSSPGGGQPPRPDASRLGTDWRTRIPDRLATLAAAWRDESAWAGMTSVGGQEFPGDVAGLIAVDEVIVHGWDVAVSSGQDFRCEPQLVEAALGFARGVVSENPQGVPGLFGPPVPVPDDAPLLDRLLGLTGRHPEGQPHPGGA
ncbi:MAG TPA: TIGR03086 family metal-binding protein [Mycobacteriales bacterium]|nr:TIGR03086 family metal-binding protein [Mycobacteriales bacterium]